MRDTDQIGGSALCRGLSSRLENSSLKLGKAAVCKHGQNLVTVDFMRPWKGSVRKERSRVAGRACPRPFPTPLAGKPSVIFGVS